MKIKYLLLFFFLCGLTLRAYADDFDMGFYETLIPPVSVVKEDNKSEPTETYQDEFEEKIINEKLTGFSVGSYKHPYIYHFSSKVTDEIKSSITKGYSIKKIEMHGYADGIKNDGVGNWSNVNYSACKLQDSGSINDMGLAHLRVCIPKEIIIKLLGYNVYTGKIKIKSYDEPDNGLVGKDFRKFVIKVIMNKHKKLNSTE